MSYLLSEIYPNKKPKIYSFFFFFEDQGIVKLLPSCHASYYPLAFNKNTNEIISGELNFFNSKFYNTYTSVKDLSDNQYDFHIVKSKEKALVINLLDDCYGHSIIKLLNLQNIYAKYNKKYDLICICPRSLKYLIPKNKFQIITIKIGFYDLSHCHNLESIINKIDSLYNHLDYYLFSMYNKFNRDSTRQFYTFYPKKYNRYNFKKNKITFYYRSGFFRSWRGNGQANAIIKLFSELTPYYSENVMYCVIGDKDKYNFPNWINDQRTEKFSLKLDLKYNTIFHESLIVIGVFGSALYLASILCDMVIHLVPRDKLMLTAEDTINYDEESILSFYQNINILGSENCNDIKPNNLAKDIITLYKSYLEKKYKTNIAKRKNNILQIQFSIGQKEYIELNYKNFNYKLAKKMESDLLIKLNNKMFLKNKINRIFPKIFSKKINF